MDRRSLLLDLLHLIFFISVVSANGVFRVQNKFGGRGPRGRSLSDLKAHDHRRRGRVLSGIDLPMGGIANPSETGLYFGQIAIGTPPKNFYVQVDTGSDILWVNCIHCKRCPRKSSLGIELTLYDPSNSKSGHLVTCDQPFCSSSFDGNQIPGCTPDVLCQYTVMYGDGSTTSGYYVKDFVSYNQVSGNLQTTMSNASVIFGCGAQQSGDLGSSSEALDGILGFGQSNSSMISQLASSGKVKKMFSHCLDGENGGGIFAIGQVVQPKMKTTPLLPNHLLTLVELCYKFPTDVFDTGDGKGAIIDSGTTLAYIPEVAYYPLINAIKSSQPSLNLQSVQELLCFHYTGRVDDGFPPVTLHFDNSLTLTIDPHDYLFQINDETWCIGWQNSGLQSKDAKDMTLLGDLVLSNKLVYYDLENQVIGWTEYNCSSSIKIQDEKTGAVYSVRAHDLSSAYSLEIGWIQLFLLLTAMLLNLIY